MVQHADFDTVKIVKADASFGSEDKGTGSITTSQASYNFGGSSDLWSETWTAANINDSDFGVAVSFIGVEHGTANYTTNYIKGTNFGFSIPTDATIDGIEAEVSCRYTGGQNADVQVFYIKITVTYTEAAGGTNMQVNIGDVWKEVPAAKINIGDVWKDVAGAQVNIGDAWKTIF